MKKRLEKMRALESSTMLAHSSKDKYFETLEKDPYGFNNASFDWSGENKFILVASILYISCISIVLYLEYIGLISTINLNIYFIFFIAILIELAGKMVAAYAVRNFRIKINYVRKLLLRPWRKLKIYIISLFFVIQGKDAIQVVLILFLLDQMKTILTEWNVIRRKFRFWHMLLCHGIE